MSALVGGRAAAQQAPVTKSARVLGVVRTADGAGAPGVTVELAGTVWRATTSATGAFVLARVAPGTYVLEARCVGLLPAQARVTVAAGRDSRVDLTLKPAWIVPPTGSAIALPPVEVEGQTSRNGVGVSAAGSNDYAVTARDIKNLPGGENTAITDVLTQMPGVAIDQNQQIHIRNTEGPQFQYQINGVLVPLDINTNPPFISMLNPMFVSKMDLLDGVLPARYSYATGGVIDIQTKDGCDNGGGSVSALLGQRGSVAPSVQYAGCHGKASYYFSGVYDQGETAFSSATPGPNPIHNWTSQGQGFGYFSVPVGNTTALHLILSTAASTNQLPNVANLTPQFTLAGVPDFNSAAINSYLNFRDYLGMLTLSGNPDTALSYQVSYSVHAISQSFVPDDDGELIFQGVASTASHNDLDNTLQGDLTYATRRHIIGAGMYVGEYHVIPGDTSLVFPVDSGGNQTSMAPVTVINNTQATNVVFGVYLDDLWRISDKIKLNVGLRWDDVTGFTANNQVDPTFNLSYDPSPKTTLHAGVARYMQVPSFLGISPTASDAFAGTTAGGPPGVATPLTEDDVEFDVGVVHRLSRKVTVSQDNFYETTEHYLDTGQFGVVPIFAPFNYEHGTIWGSESAVTFRGDAVSGYGNVTIGRNLQQGVLTGQFNFSPDELAYIDTHPIVLDHQPLVGVSAGASERWRRLTLSLDLIYSSGLRAGFADEEQLPAVLQCNAGIAGEFHLPGLGHVTDRLTVLNLFDRINLIRPAQGIGIFQAAYGPRFTLLNTFTVSF